MIDNAETLARAPSEEEELHAILNEISRRVARVIVTSRRYEAIQAEHIRVPGLDIASAVDLLEALANRDNIDVLLYAEYEDLKKRASDLNCKPLLLEAFSNYVAAGLTIESAVDQVRAAAGGDLGVFLYEDAWNRMVEGYQKISIVLSLLDRPINKYTVGWTCRKLGVLHTDWIDSFLETSFGTYHDMNVDYDIVLLPESANFFRSKLDTLPENDRRHLKEVVTEITQLYDKLESADRMYRQDRIDGAFKTSAAKAARMAANRGRHDEAEMWFEEATAQDPANSELFDRYAYFLVNYTKNYRKSAEKSKMAVHIDPNNEEALFTAGITQYHLGNIDAGDDYLVRAYNAKKPLHLCLIQKVKGYLRCSDEFIGAERTQMLENALLNLERAIKALPRDDRFYNKNLSDCKKSAEAIDEKLPKRKRSTSQKILDSIAALQNLQNRVLSDF